MQLFLVTNNSDLARAAVCFHLNTEEPAPSAGLLAHLQAAIDNPNAVRTDSHMRGKRGAAPVFEIWKTLPTSERPENRF